MTQRELTAGSKGWCRNCGFAIEVQVINTNLFGFYPRWRPVWVHTTPNSLRIEQHCMWTAEPKRHRKPRDLTLYEQISAGRVRVRELERELARANYELEGLRVSVSLERTEAVERHEV